MSTLLPEFRNRLALIGRAGSDAAEWEELRGRQLRQRLQNESMSRAMSASRSSRGGDRNIQYGPVSSNIKIGHPLGGAGRQSSNYGWRSHPIKKKQSFHTGLDLAAKAGTPVYATHAGVGRSSYDKIYGNRVILSGGNGMETRYAHLARSVIQQGQQIKAGQLLGYVGSTGLSTGPHLHFETWLNGRHVNPLSYFMR